MTLADYGIQIERARGRLGLLQTQQKEAEAKLLAALTEEDIYTQAQTLLNTASTASRVQLKNMIEPLLTEALQLLLGPAAAFQLNFDNKRGAVTAHLLTTDNEEIEAEGTESHGGGVLDTESVLLRLIFILRCGLPKLLVLDEPFRNLHGAESLETVSTFIQHLCSGLGFQILISTGDEDMSLPEAEMIVTVTKTGNEALIKVNG